MRKADYLIRIYRTDGAYIAGVVEHVATGQGYGFSNVLDMVVMLQNDMDRRSFPQPGYELRCWPGDESMRHSYLLENECDADELQEIFIRGSIAASFWLSVRFRQNADWQGELVWMERRCSCNFRSLLELMVLLESALANKRRMQSHLVHNASEREKQTSAC